MVTDLNFSVPVSLVTQGQLISSTSTTTVGSVSSASTAVALAERGCEMEGTFYPNGAQVISDPTKPCELCYCIRNRTACVMQECILHVEGCEPVFEPGVCCPVRYQCDIPPKIETTTSIAGLISTTLTSIFITSTQQPGGCYRDGEFYADGSQIQTPGEAPCEHCYCMRGEVRHAWLHWGLRTGFSYRSLMIMHLSDCLCSPRVRKPDGRRRWKLYCNSAKGRIVLPRKIPVP